MGLACSRLGADMGLLDGTLGMGRRMALSRMSDTCTVTRAGSPVFNETTGQYTSTTVSVYSGACRVKQAASVARDVDAGSQLLAVTQLELHLPLSAVGVRAGDLVTITGSETRAEQSGRKFSVVAPFDGSQTTALRFRIETADER